MNAQRRAIESMAPEEVLVIEARGEPDAGTFGDVFALRALRRGATGMITDGAVRDTPAVAELDIAVYHGASHAATFSRTHMPLEHQIPIACAGVTVMPGDIMVGDGEGVVVIPPSLVVELAAASVQQEAEETLGAGASRCRREHHRRVPGVEGASRRVRGVVRGSAVDR